MAGNPGIPQGTINRLLASVFVTNYPELNITSSFLAPEAISIAPEGQATTQLPSLTSIVNSGEPYQIIRCTAHLIRSQGLANAWKMQYENTTFLGPVTVRPDVTTMDPWYLNFASIINFSALTFNGREVGYVLELAGSYDINAALWGF